MASFFAQLILIANAIFLIASAVIIQSKNKKIAIFMKVIKGIITLSIIIGIVDLVAVILWIA